MTLDQQAVTPARPPIPVEQRWWEKRPVAPGFRGAPRPAAVARGALVPRGRPGPAAPPATAAAAQAATARIAVGSLPAPPPLSAPLGLAGTGPMPQLSQTMAPPGATIWWSAPVPGSASAQRRSASALWVRATGPVPHGSVPHAPGAPVPGPSAPGP